MSDIRPLIPGRAWAAASVATLLIGVSAPTAGAVTLLDDSFEDADRTDTNLPDESAFYFGTDVAVNQVPGTIEYTTPTSSSKAHIYFAPDGQFSRLGVGDTLSASFSFTPQVAMNFDDTSRSFRFGVFHDPTDPQVQNDTNDDGGGSGDPWTDAAGYGVQIAMLDDPANTRSPFDLGKRTDLGNSSLLGSSGAYTKSSGGAAADMNVGTSYTYTMDITKNSASVTDVTVSLSDGSGVLSSYSVSDNGVDLGTDAPYDDFSFIHFRWSNEFETAAQFDLESIVVNGPALIPEPASAAMLGAAGVLVSVRRRARR